MYLIINFSILLYLSLSRAHAIHTHTYKMRYSRSLSLSIYIYHSLSPIQQTHTQDAVLSPYLYLCLSLSPSHTTHTHTRCGMGVIQSCDMFFSFSRQRGDQGYKSWQSCPTQKLIKRRKNQALRSNKPLPAILILY